MTTLQIIAAVIFGGAIVVVAGNFLRERFGRPDRVQDLAHTGYVIGAGHELTNGADHSYGGGHDHAAGGGGDGA